MASPIAVLAQHRTTAWKDRPELPGQSCVGGPRWLRKGLNATQLGVESALLLGQPWPSQGSGD